MSRQIESKTIFSAVDKISPIVNKIEKNLIPLGSRLEKVGKSLSGFGGSTFFKSSAGLTGMFLGAVKPAMNFEKAMGNVFKVLDDSHFKKFKLTKDQFSNEVLKMSGDMAIDAVSMAQVFENMPLVSLKNQNELLGMAKLVGRSIKTMGIDATYAGESVKTFYNILGNDYGATQKAINAVNALGNRFGSKPADILESARMGALAQGTGLGLSTEHTLSFATSFIQLGATPDRAKTSFDHLTNALIKSSSATKEQKEAFKMLGMTAEQATKAFLGNKSETIADIFTRLSKLDLDKQGIAFIKLFGLEGLNNIKALQKNMPLLQEAFKTVADPLKYSKSIQEEYFKLKILNAFKIEEAWVKINNTITKVTNLILPRLGKIADKISDLVDKYEKLTPETKKLIGDTVLFTAGMLSFGAAVGGVSYALGGLVTAMSMVSRAGKLMTGVEALGMFGGVGGGKKNAKGLAPANGNKFTKTMKMPQVLGKSVGVDMLGGFDVKPANSNGKIGLLKKMGSVALNVAGAFAFLGVNSTRLFSILSIGARIFSRFILPVGIIVGLAEGIYRKWNELIYVFDRMGTRLNVLAEAFGLGGAGGKIKSGAIFISDLLGDIIGNTLVGLIEMANKLIYALTFSANLAKTKSWSGAGMLTDEMIKQQSLSPKQKEKQLNNVREIERAIMSMPIGNDSYKKIQEQIVKIDVKIQDNQIQVMRNGKILQTSNRGNNSPTSQSFALPRAIPYGG